MVEVLILSAIALFVLSRLYIALGRDDGPPQGRTRASGQPRDLDTQTGPLATGGDESPEDQDGDGAAPVFSGPGSDGLEMIHAADPDFDAREFLRGARGAYEMIVEAFANGDREQLKPLLDTDVYQAWSDALDVRETEGREPWRLLRLKEAEINDASLEGRTARVMVRYRAELGDGERTRTAREVWTFKRDTGASDPNWLLDDVETAG